MSQRKAASPIEVQRYLSGVDYPSDKSGLLDVAKENDAPQEVLDTLDELPDTEFDSPAAVTKALGESGQAW